MRHNDYGAVRAERDRLAQALADCSKEYHAAISEPEYAGTRADWIHRAQAAEAKVEDLRRALEDIASGDETSTVAGAVAIAKDALK